MGPFIHQKPEWPLLTWDDAALAKSLMAARTHQSHFLGRMQGLGFQLQQEAQLTSMTLEVVKSSEIEGEILAPDEVRSSIARRLGMDAAGLIPAERQVEGVVEMMIDATRNSAEPLTNSRLFRWHASLFATGVNGLRIGAWREGPMQVISGPMGRAKVHFEAPEAERVAGEMTAFLKWENASEGIDPVLKAGLAHLWFVTVHPFDDGNGRIARAISELELTRAEKGSQRFYSQSAQIRTERKDYYDILERTQRGPLDVTEWLQWYLGCLDRAIGTAEASLVTVLRRDLFWRTHAGKTVNERQRLLLNMLIDGFTGKLKSSKWATIAKCSQPTAIRDIEELIKFGILVQDPGGGRNTSYSLAPFGA